VRKWSPSEIRSAPIGLPFHLPLAAAPAVQRHPQQPSFTLHRHDAHRATLQDFPFHFPLARPYDVVRATVDVERSAFAISSNPTHFFPSWHLIPEA
jgi:hypothetical protein